MGLLPCRALQTPGETDRTARQAMRRQPLTTAEILSWADAHKARHGDWPRIAAVQVEAAPFTIPGKGVDTPRRYGLRGLPPGGAPLARPLPRERGYRTPPGLPP